MAKVKTKGGRLPVRAYLLYLLLISFMLTGVTFSRYITSSRGDEGARVVKAGEIRIEENGDFYKPGVLAVAPGADLKKDATVVYDGGEYAAYIFLTVDITGFTRSGTYHCAYTPHGSSDEAIYFDINKAWQVLYEDGSKVVFYVTLEPNINFERKIIDNNGLVSVSDSLHASDIRALPSLGISFDAFAVQAGGFEGKDARECALNAYKAAAGE